MRQAFVDPVVPNCGCRSATWARPRFRTRFLPADDLDRSETFYPLHARGSASRAGWYKFRLSSLPSSIFNAGYAYFSSYSDSWLRHAERFCGRHDDAAGPGSTVRSSSRLPVTTGTCCSTSSNTEFGCSGSSRPRTGAEVAESRGIAPPIQFSGGTAEVHACGGGGRIRRQTTCSPMCPTSMISWRAQNLSRAPWRCHMEFPHLLRLMRATNSTRSITSTFRTCRSIGREQDIRRSRTHAVRRRRAPDPWRLCASLRGMPRTARRVEANVADLQHGGAAGRARPSLDDYQDFGRHVQESKRKLLTFLIRAKEEGKKGVGLWRTGKGQHAVELLRDQI